jgi:hypothetical protein
MKDHSGSPSEGPHDGEKRFDDEAARRILRRAAEEQARQEDEEVGSFTLEELQKIATEAGISPEAVRAAALELEAGADPTNPELPVAVPGGGDRAVGGSGDGAVGGGGGGWLAALKRRMPASWSPAVKNVVLIGVGVALLGLVVSNVGVGPVVFTLSAVILVLIFVLILVGVGL